MCIVLSSCAIRLDCKTREKFATRWLMKKNWQKFGISEELLILHCKIESPAHFLMIKLP